MWWAGRGSCRLSRRSLLARNGVGVLEGVVVVVVVVEIVSDCCGDVACRGRDCYRFEVRYGDGGGSCDLVLLGWDEA